MASSGKTSSIPADLLECTDRQFLPPAIAEKMTAAGGRAKLQERLTALKQIVREL